MTLNIVYLSVSLSIDSCGSPPIVQNGRFSDGGVSIGSRRTLICDRGFQLDGNENIQCFEGSVWSDVGSCSPLVRCLDVPHIPGGTVSNGDTAVHSTRNISCDEGYALVGSKGIYCLPSGQWTTPGLCTKSIVFENNIPLFVRSFV